MKVSGGSGGVSRWCVETVSGGVLEVYQYVVVWLGEVRGGTESLQEEKWFHTTMVDLCSI